MKLYIKETCVVAGGKIKSSGEFYETKHEDPASDREAYDLIAAGRALKADDPEVKEIIASQKAAKEAADAEAAKANKNK